VGPIDHWLAQDPTAPAGAFASLIQLGAVGGIAALLLWFAYRAYQAEKARADRTEKVIECSRLEDPAAWRACVRDQVGVDLTQPVR
jgi:hypothetical protein